MYRDHLTPRRRQPHPFFTFGTLGGFYYYQTIDTTEGSTEIYLGKHTIRELETLQRGAYPKTIRRLCKALELRPIELTFRTDIVPKIGGDAHE